MRTRVLGTIVVVASLALSASAAQAAYDMFLEVPGVDNLKGESTADNYPDQIEVFSLSWGVNKQPNVKPSFSSINVLKAVDRASPALLQDVASGATFDSANLHFVKRGDTPRENLTFCLTGVRFTSLQDSASAGGENQVTESLSFTYQTIVEKYKRQDATGAFTGDPITGGWDLVKNLQFGGACS
jgi:type VI secretion system secreted protein Hcp